MSKDAEPINSIEERLFFLEKKHSGLQSENKSMRTSWNDLLKEQIAWKEHNTVLVDMINDPNSYITQLRFSPLSDHNANTQPVVSTPDREQKIPDPSLFSGNRSKPRNWIIDISFKLAANAQLFWNK